MWGELVLQPPQKDKLISLPAVIEFHDTRSTHFIGRLPNPSATTYMHRCQHVIPLQFLSATHCSLSIERTNDAEAKYILKDLSSNGTFYKRGAEAGSGAGVHKVGKGNTIDLVDGDEVIFKFKDDTIVNYIFHPIETQEATAEGKGSHGNLLNNQIQQLQEELTLAEERLATSNKRLNDLREELNTAQSTIASMTTAQAQKNEEIDKLKETVESLNANTAATEAYSRKLKNELAEKTSSMSSLAAKLEETADDLRRKSEQLAKRNAVVQEANRLCAEQSEQYAKSEKEVARCKTVISGHETVIDRLKEANSVLQDLACEQDLAIKKMQTEAGAAQESFERIKASESARQMAMKQLQDDVQKWTQSTMTSLVALTNGTMITNEVNTAMAKLARGDGNGQDIELAAQGAGKRTQGCLDSAEAEERDGSGKKRQRVANPSTASGGEEMLMISNGGTGAHTNEHAHEMELNQTLQDSAINVNTCVAEETDGQFDATMSVRKESVSMAIDNPWDERHEYAGEKEDDQSESDSANIVAGNVHSNQWGCTQLPEDSIDDGDSQKTSENANESNMATEGAGTDGKMDEKDETGAHVDIDAVAHVNGQMTDVPERESEPASNDENESDNVSRDGAGELAVGDKEKDIQKELASHSPQSGRQRSLSQSEGESLLKTLKTKLSSDYSNVRRAGRVPGESRLPQRKKRNEKRSDGSGEGSDSEANDADDDFDYALIASAPNRLTTESFLQKLKEAGNKKEANQVDHENNGDKESTESPDSRREDHDNGNENENDKKGDEDGAAEAESSGQHLTEEAGQPLSRYSSTTLRDFE